MKKSSSSFLATSKKDLVVKMHGTRVPLAGAAIVPHALLLDNHDDVTVSQMQI